MTSKNLYWAKWRENIKRRGWTLAFCFMALFLMLPVVNIIELNGSKSEMGRAAQSGASAATLEGYFEAMQQRFAQNVGFSTVMTLCMALFAILFAVHGFSFLYSRQKMDLYMSVPVSGPKRYAMLWTNGILMFAFCYLPNLIITWAIGAAFGVMDAPLLAGSVLAFFANMLAYTAMYQLALLAVFLTGNVLSALLGCGVLFIYEMVVRLLYGGLKTRFFVSYCSADLNRLSERPWFTPFCGYMELCDGIWYEGSAVGGYNSYDYLFGNYGRMPWYEALLWEVLLLLVAAVVVGALAYLVFRKRKTESYHQSIAFPGLKGVLEFLLLVPFSLAAALFVSDMAADESFFLFAGALGGILIGHGILQLIYERDLKAVLKRKGALAVSLVATALVLVLFRFDLTGFDDYIPQREKIESLAVSLESDYSSFGWYVFEGNTSSSRPAARLLTQMDSQDPATIGAVLHMAALWQDAGMPTQGSGSYGSAVRIEASPQAVAEREAEEAGSRPWENGNWFVVRYDLTNGRTVYRRFLVDASLCPDELNAVLSDDSYRQNRYQIYEDDFAAAVDSMKIAYSDGKQELIYTTDKKQLYEAYLKDFEGYDYALIDAQLPCGVLKFAMPDSENYRGYDWIYPVYDSFVNTIGILAQNDIDAGVAGSILSPEDVKEITVRYYVYDNDEEETLFEPGEVPGQTIVCSFESEEEIGQILKGVYSWQLEAASGEEFKALPTEGQFGVDVALTSEALKKRYTADDLFFLKGGVPEFVIKKIKESAVRN